MKPREQEKTTALEEEKLASEASEREARPATFIVVDRPPEIQVNIILVITISVTRYFAYSGTVNTK